MKQLFTFILFVCSFAATAQETAYKIPTDATGNAKYEWVVPAEGMSQQQIYLAAMEWVNKTYASGKAVIQVADQSAAYILGKGNGSNLIFYNVGKAVDGGYFKHTFTIQAKDNRYKFTIEAIKYRKGYMALAEGADLAEKFPHNWTGLIMNSKHNRKQWLNMQQQAHMEFEVLNDTLAKYILNAKTAANW